MSRTGTLIVAIIVVLLIGSAASLSAGSAKFKCTANGRVFDTTLETNSVFRVTLTWSKATPDNDLLLFDPESGLLLGIGIGLATRYEFVAIAGLVGFPVEILAIKAGGEDGPCFLRWSGELVNTSNARVGRLRNRGRLDKLEASDPKYARMKSTVE